MTKTKGHKFSAEKYLLRKLTTNLNTEFIENS